MNERNLMAYKMKRKDFYLQRRSVVFSKRNLPIRIATRGHSDRCSRHVKVRSSNKRTRGKTFARLVVGCRPPRDVRGNRNLVCGVQQQRAFVKYTGRFLVWTVLGRGSSRDC